MNCTMRSKHESLQSDAKCILVAVKTEEKERGAMLLRGRACPVKFGMGFWGITVHRYGGNTTRTGESSEEMKWVINGTNFGCLSIRKSERRRCKIIILIVRRILYGLCRLLSDAVGHIHSPRTE